MSICLSEYVADPRLIMSWHVIPDRWLLQGGTVGGGGALNWFEKQLGAQERIWAAEQGGNSFEQLSREAGRGARGQRRAGVPAVHGGPRRSPLWNPNAKGVFYGLDYTKTRRAHGARGDGGRGVLGAAQHRGGKELRSSGRRAARDGAVRPTAWFGRSSRATYSIGRSVVPDSDNATTLGAALLAGCGRGRVCGL